ncbi:STE24 endopeptidase [Ekhidna lutea]|uniref:STE24 endopeptidase n=1 Tax=Ekhidna lutea TaxID=447679 RepID=A0A239LYI8_EKHLU|nr:M48 family metallopeptidase [Ekhidna lutea]SNT35727.1 STE24 endopeptidase [Ekhidna lutea]
MTEQTIFTILLAIITFDFALERVLNFLNRKSAKKPIPKELEGIYDKEKYAKSQAYQAEVSQFSMFSATFSFVLLVLAIYNGWFGMLDQWIRTFSPYNLTSPLFFFGILFIVSDVINTPFSIYRNFVIEAKYGFNKMTVKTFILDKIKGYILTIIIGGLLLGVLIYLVNAIGSDFWYYFWAIMAAFVLFANLFYTSLILPLFNKLTPMDEGELKSSIQSYCDKVNFPLKNIFIMDGSKRSSKGNAFFSGLGKKKKVVLFDTLVEKHSVQELTAVFAHEVGHYKKKHILFTTIFSIGMMGFMLFLFSRMAYSAEVSWAMGGQTSALHLNLLAFGILYSPISTLLGIIGNVISRKNEYEADAYAKETYDGTPLITGLKRMSADHLSNLTPHPAFVFVHYSHPPLKERVKALER